MSLIAHSQNSVASGAVTTPGVDTTGVNVILLAVSTTFAGSTPTDSNINTWTQIGGGGATHNTSFSLWFCFNPTVGAAHTFTNPDNGSGFNQAIVMVAFNDIIQVLGTILDGANTIAVGDPPTPAQAGAVTPSQNDCLLIAVGVTEQGTIPGPTPDSGFTVGDSNNQNLGQAITIAYKFDTTPSAENPTWTLGAGALHWGAILQSIFSSAPITSITVPSTTLQITSYPPILGQTLLDEDFSSYSIGQNPPFANLEGSGTIQDTVPGPYADTQTLSLGASEKVSFPILPTITLAQAQAGVTYESLGVPFYSEATVYQAIYIDFYPDMEGQILEFHSNLNPFAGVEVAAVRILSDGTITFSAPASSSVSPNQAISTYSLYPGKWYFFQTNIAFTNDGGFVHVDITVAVNGVPVVLSSWTTVQPISGLPGNYFNQVVFGSAGNGAFIGRLTINSILQTMPSFPHAGSPLARVTQGIIEIAKFVESTVPLGASCPISSAALGIPYSQFVTTIGGVAPLTFAVTSGSLPTGLSLNASTGLISGTPSAVGSYSYEITVTPSSGSPVVIECMILVPPTPIRPARFCTSQT